MKDKFLITFAGPMGSSKTTIAYYLSYKLNLPIFSNDGLRAEVIADMGSLDSEEYEKRRSVRLKDISSRGVSFIYDASVDREWAILKKNAESFGYQTFIISMDLSKGFLVSLYERGERYNDRYAQLLKSIDASAADHKNFLEGHSNEVGLHISDENFAKRLDISYEKVRDWLNR